MFAYRFRSFGPTIYLRVLENTLSSNSSLMFNKRSCFSSVFEITPENSKLFFSDKTQSLLKKLTGLDLEKVYRTRAVGDVVTPPQYQFMTNSQLKEAQADAIRRAYLKLQIPPLVPINKGTLEILDETPEMIGFTQAKYVFTDITFNVSDAKRWIVVREPNGVLRKAFPSERHRMNQLYFAREGRSYLHPEMFNDEHVKRLCESGEFEFILDRASAHYEPDYPDYHRVIFYVFDMVYEKKAFNDLRSTRHFGTMLFYLCLKKKLYNIAEEMLETERLEDIIDFAELYTIVHPNSDFSMLKTDRADEMNYLRQFLEKEFKNPAKLLQIMETYWQAEQKPIES